MSEERTVISMPKAVAMFVASMLVAMVGFGLVLYGFDRLYVQDRDEALCAVLSSQGVVISTLVEDLAAAGESVSPRMLQAAVDLRAASDGCADL